MSSKDERKAIFNQEIQRFERTRDAFRHAQGLIRKSQFPGSDAGLVIEALNLLKHMEEQSGLTLKKLREQQKAGLEKPEFEPSELEKKLSEKPEEETKVEEPKDEKSS